MPSFVAFYSTPNEVKALHAFAGHSISSSELSFQVFACFSLLIFVFLSTHKNSLRVKNLNPF